MVINKKANKIQTFFKVNFVKRVFVEAPFVGTVFVSSSYDLATINTILSHVITKLPIILPTYFLFSHYM